MLVELTRKLNLPLAVRCTSILLYNRIRDKLALGDQQLAHLSLFMGCKFEDVHGHLERLLASAGCRGGDIERLVESEIAAFEHIGFDFSYPNLYVKAQGLRLLLSERGATVSSTWEDDCAAIDRALCSEELFAKTLSRGEWNTFCNEVAFAAIGADSGLAPGLDLGMSVDSIEAIRKVIKG